MIVSPKIRGFRIELGEVERVLDQHPAIRETVVIAREDVPGDKRLAAYVCCAPDTDPSTNELRDFLKQKLPVYMVPATFVRLDAFPLTPNGKIDRRALPLPDGDRSDLEITFVAARNLEEEIVSKIWGEVLNIDPVGVHDNFFELGGDSLLVTQVISRLHQTFQLNIPVRTFFEVPTIAELVAVIEASLIEEIEQLSEHEVLRLLGDSRNWRGPE